MSDAPCLKYINVFICSLPKRHKYIIGVSDSGLYSKSALGTYSQDNCFSLQRKFHDLLYSRISLFSFSVFISNIYFPLLSLATWPFPWIFLLRVPHAPASVNNFVIIIKWLEVLIAVFASAKWCENTPAGVNPPAESKWPTKNYICGNLTFLALATLPGHPIISLFFLSNF